MERARAEFAAILAGQWRNGMLPHIRYLGTGAYAPTADQWGIPSGLAGVPTSGITQPPLVGFALARLAPHLDASTLKEFCERVDAYHDWLFRERDPRGEHLVCCIHPWETGTDNAPHLMHALRVEEIRERPAFVRVDTHAVPPEERPFDREYEGFSRLITFFADRGYDQERIVAESPFLVQDVLFNAILLASLEAMAEVDVPRAKKHAERADAMRRAMQKFWKDGFFYSYDLRRGEHIPVRTIAGLMPLLAGATKEQYHTLLELAMTEFAPDAFIASTSPREQAFDPIRYWAGPVWPPMNWLLIQGVRGPYRERLLQGTLELIEQGHGPQPELASGLLEHNRIGDCTTPSRHLYHHAWLWDSCIATIGWMHAIESNADWDALAGHPNRQPMFDEYYAVQRGVHPSCAPLGSPMMTWTAAVYLDLLAERK